MFYIYTSSPEFIKIQHITSKKIGKIWLSLNGSNLTQTSRLVEDIIGIHKQPKNNPQMTLKKIGQNVNIYKKL